MRRYRKIKEDMPLLSGEDRGRYFGKRGFCIKTNVIYLLLSSSTSFYLHVTKQMSFISLYLHLPPFISFSLNLPLSTTFAHAKLRLCITI
ncbi:MAG: hypothetical protein J6J71_06575 [Prevotella sp.]|nr:hypothetical protein [Prevotella sp.]